MRIKVTTADIEAADQIKLGGFSAVICPVSQAMMRTFRALGKDLREGAIVSGKMYIFYNAVNLIVTPTHVADFMGEWDRDEPVEPISFDVPDTSIEQVLGHPL